MSRAPALSSAFACLVLLAACGGSGSGSPVPPGAATPAAGSELALLPNSDASATLGDTERLSGGEFVGEQAEATLEQAVAMPIVAGMRRYAFLVLITGRDPDTFPYNLRDFRLFDDLDYQYNPLSDGGKTPRLE